MFKCIRMHVCIFRMPCLEEFKRFERLKPLTFPPDSDTHGLPRAGLKEEAAKYAALVPALEGLGFRSFRS